MVLSAAELFDFDLSVSVVVFLASSAVEETADWISSTCILIFTFLFSVFSSGTPFIV